MMVRVAWGGGSEKLWEGSIAVSRGTISQPRPLGIEADEPGSMWLEDGRLLVRQRSPRAYDGVDIIVTAPADAKLIVQLAAAAGRSARSGPQIEVPLADISSEFRNLQLDDRENRLLVRRAPGDSLLVRTSHPSMVFYPGETMRFEVIPHLLARGCRHPRADQGPVARRPAAAVVVQRAGRPRRQRGSHSAGTRPCRKTRAFTTS